MAEEGAILNQSKWVVVNQDARTGLFSSIRAGTAWMGHKKIYSQYERPPYPILIDKPTPSDLMKSWKASDFFLFGSFYTFGVLASYVASRGLPTMSARLLVYHSASHLFLVTGGMIDRKSTRLNSSHSQQSRMPSSA